MNTTGLTHINSLACYDARHIVLATHDKPGPNGRTRGSLKAVPHAVAAAVMVLGMSPAWSAEVCTGNASFTLTGTQATGDTCVPDTGAALVIGPTGVLSGANRGITTSAGTSANSIDNQGSVSGNRSGVRVPLSPIGSLANSGTITGTTSYEGVLLQAGGGLTGNLTNTSTGTISGGTGINLDGYGGTIGGDVINEGTITGTAFDGIRLDEESTISGVIANSGTIQGTRTGIWVVDDSGTVGSAVTGGVNNSGTISGGTGDGIYVDVYSRMGSITNSGTISGANFAINDLSVSIPNIEITGNNTARFIGDVKAAGTSVSVKSGATFANSNAFDVFGFFVENTGRFNFGVGTPTASGLTTSGVKVGSNGFSNAGTVAIADGVTASITGNYTQTSTGTLSVGASANTGFGKLVVSGTAALPGGAKIYVDVNGVNTVANGQTMSGVLSAGTLNATTFAVTTNSVLFSFTGTANGNAVDLAVASAGSGSGASTVLAAVSSMNNTQASGVARVLDSIITAAPGGDMGTVVTALGSLTTTQQVSDAAKQALPLLTGNLNLMTGSTQRDINRAVLGRTQFNRGIASGDGVYGDKNVWVKPFASNAVQDDQNGVSGFKANSGGFVLGADAATSAATRMGGAFAYVRSKVDGNDAAAPSQADVNVYSLIGYGTVQWDQNTQANFVLDVGSNTNQGTRTINFGGLRRVAASSFSGLAVHAGAGIERTVQLGNANTFTPSVRADYTVVRDDAYTETGAGALNLAVESNTSRSFVLAADGRFEHAYDIRQTLSVNLGAGYDTLASRTAVVAAFAGTAGSSFTTQGPEVSAWMVRAGAGYAYKKSDATDITARYDVDIRNKFANQTVSLKARWLF